MYYAAKALGFERCASENRGVLSQFGLELVKTGVMEDCYAKD